MIIENDSLEVLRTCGYSRNDMLGAMVSDNLYLSIVVTNVCQRNCPYCINSLTDRSLSLPLKKGKVNIRRAVEEFGIKEAVILGGEPTLYPGLFELIRFLRSDCGLRKVGLTTNGIKLRDADFLDSLVGTGIDFVNISYHSHGEFLERGEMAAIYRRFREVGKRCQKIRVCNSSLKI